MNNKKLKKVAACVLVSILTFSELGFDTFTEEASEKRIVSFQEISEEITIQELEVGSLESDIFFPKSLGFYVKKVGNKESNNENDLKEKAKDIDSDKEKKIEDDEEEKNIEDNEEDKKIKDIYPAPRYSALKSASCACSSGSV